jgi:hypothetical protein
MHTRGEYYSFLLRLWRVNPESGWCVSLTPVGSEKQLNFSRLEDAMAFLEAQPHTIGEEGKDECHTKTV